MENRFHVCVVGLGYVGLPLAYRMRQAGHRVTGYDINEELLTEIKSGIDPTGLIPPIVLSSGLDIDWTGDLPANADMYIVCVPTPVTYHPTRGVIPDNSFVFAAMATIALEAASGAYIVLESTVAPGTTEMVRRDMMGKTKHHPIAYSPERINPGPNSYEELGEETKIICFSENVSPSQIGEIVEVYARSFRDVEVFMDTRIGEVAKCFENAQRDMNIALMNELSIHCNANEIDLLDVIAALRTKPSSPKFMPGLVGGHCIPVDPYYLAAWYGTMINDISLPQHSRECHDDYLESLALTLIGNSDDMPVLIIGKSYKPDITDTRNAGGIALYNRLQADDIPCILYDPLIDGDLDTEYTFTTVVGVTNHTGFLSQLLYALPLSSDCTFYNVGCQFRPDQLFGIENIINY